MKIIKHLARLCRALIVLLLLALRRRRHSPSS